MLRPNILMFLPDQFRHDWLGFNKELPLITPNINKLCDKGTRFTNAFTASPLCAPSRACLASGLKYSRCGVKSNFDNYQLKIPTFYQKLKDAGYIVCGVGKFDLFKNLAKPPSELNWKKDGSLFLSEWGFTHGINNEGKLDGSNSYIASGIPKGPYTNFLYKRGLIDIYIKEHLKRKESKDAYITSLPDDAYCDNWLSNNGIRFLREFPKNKPWYMVVNFTGPHNPMDVTKAMSRKFEEVSFPAPLNNNQKHYKENDHLRIRRNYAAMIENIDRQVGRFIKEVVDRKELEKTIIIFSSDHGEMLGDHNLWGKNTWHHPSIKVPMIICGPRISSGTINKSFIYLHDLTKTIIEFSNSKPIQGIDSKSIVPILENNKNIQHDFIIAGLPEWRMIFDGKYKYIEQIIGPPILYSLKDDRFELDNIALNNSSIVNKLKKSLELNF